MSPYQRYFFPPIFGASIDIRYITLRRESFWPNEVSTLKYLPCLRKRLWQIRRKKSSEPRRGKMNVRGVSVYFKGRKFRWKKLSRFRGFWPVSRKFLPRNFSKSLNRESFFREISYNHRRSEFLPRIFKIPYTRDGNLKSDWLTFT